MTIGDETDDLDVLAFAQPAREHFLRPRLAQPARVGDHAMDQLNLGSAEPAGRLVLSRNVGRQRGLDAGALRAAAGAADLGGHGDAALAGEPRAGCSDGCPGAVMRFDEIAANGERVHRNNSCSFASSGNVPVS